MRMRGRNPCKSAQCASKRRPVRPVLSEGVTWAPHTSFFPPSRPTYAGAVGRNRPSLSIRRTWNHGFVSAVIERSLRSRRTTSASISIGTKRTSTSVGIVPRATTAGDIISAVCQFFGWAHRQGLVERDPTLRLRDDVPKREYRLHSWLQPEQDRRVLDACRTPDEFRAVYLLRFSGVRASEAVALRWSDIEWNDGQLWLNIKQSKTAAGVRRIPVARELAPTWSGPAC